MVAVVKGIGSPSFESFIKPDILNEYKEEINKNSNFILRKLFR